jgi:hypothetical protein
LGGHGEEEQGDEKCCEAQSFHKIRCYDRGEWNEVDVHLGRGYGQSAEGAAT